jgi:hypothetical protein
VSDAFSGWTRRDTLALGLLVLAASALVWPVFVPGRIIPQGGGDLVSFLWPTYRYAAQSLHLVISGRAPFSALLWNPRLYSGAPFAADNQTGLFYPPNLALFLLFPGFPYQLLEFLVGLHLFIAGAGMYLLARYEFVIGQGPSSTRRWTLEVGLFPALAFMASDVFITHLGNYNIVAVSAYLPSVFLCLRAALRLGQRRWAAVRAACLAGLFFGLSALAGHAQMSLIVASACGLLGLYELAAQKHWRVAALSALAGLVAFGLASVALLPAFEMLNFTARAGLSYAEASRWSLPPVGLASLLAPELFGRGARDFWPAWDRVEFGYLGVSTVILAFLARRRSAGMYWLLAAVGLLVAFGAYTPFHYLLYRFVPGFGSLRVPARFVLVTDFALASLASFALAEAPAGRAIAGRWGGWLGWGGLATISAGFVTGASFAAGRAPLVWMPVLAAGLVLTTGFMLKARSGWLPALLFAELMIFGGFVEVDRADPSQGFRPGPAANWLLTQPGPTRIDVAGGPWQPDAPAVFGLEAISGITNPLALAAYDRYYWSVGYRGSPQYNFLNAQYVVAAKNAPPADSSFVPVFNEDPDVDIYLNTNAMPRVHLIYDAVFTQDSAKAFDLIHDPGFDPSAQVVLEAPPGVKPLPAAQPPNLYYTDYGPGLMSVVTETTAPGYLVLAEVWYPGWSATIDGRPAPILRANTAFMAVLVPAGTSKVDLRFSSLFLVLGAGISLTTVAALLAAWRLGRRRA